MKPRGCEHILALAVAMSFIAAWGVAPAGALIMTNDNVLPCINTGGQGCIASADPVLTLTRVVVGIDSLLGPGTLTVDGGSVLTTSTTGTGRGSVVGSGAPGTATVTGPGSEWRATRLGIGGGVPGTLVIEQGGKVTSTDGTLGDIGPGGGGVTVRGTGSRWDTTSLLVRGAGSITTEGGGIVTSGPTTIDGFLGIKASLTVAGPGTRWTVTSTPGVTNVLSVGAFGPGSLTIAGGAMVESGLAEVGLADSGSVLVMDNGSRWTSGQLILGGDNGTGTVAIKQGGQVSSSEGLVGLGFGSSGDVLVSNVGAPPGTPAAKWTVAGEIAVGSLGNGKLTIIDHGVVTSGAGFVGSFSSGVGEVTVTGTGSQWTVTGVTGLLEVGGQGSGTLTVGAGGVVASDSAVLGRFAGSTGTVTVTDAGSKWFVFSDLVVGAAGTGTLTIDQGGVVTSITGTVGSELNSTGGVIVTGAGSKWTVAGDLVVGDGGTGALSIRRGGQVSSSSGLVGNEPFSSGDVLVTNVGAAPGTPAAQWTIAGDLTVGALGKGTLTIIDGGVVTSASGHVGLLPAGVVVTPFGTFPFPAGVGEVRVTGAGSQWNLTGILVVGDGGTGTLTIENGGVVDSGPGTVGAQAGSHGTVTVTGVDGLDFLRSTIRSKWAVGGFAGAELRVGDGGTGTLTIENGGVVDSGPGTVGAQAGSHGTVTVTGVDGLDFFGSTIRSTWNVFGLVVGDAGKGALTIDKGGVVNSGPGTVGAQAGATGTVTVTGAGSTWNLGALFGFAPLTVGDRGMGTLTIDQGGLVTSGIGTVGAQAGSHGTVTVTGRSTWTVVGGLFFGGELRVGDAGTGTLTIDQGGLVTSSTGTVGAQAGSQGAVTVTGVDGLDFFGATIRSTWTVGGLVVGDAGKGALTIDKGGLVNSGPGTVGAQAGSQGTVTVTGAGSTWNVGGFFATDPLTVGDAGMGTLTIDKGGLVTSGIGTVGAQAGSQGTVTVTGTGLDPLGATIRSTWTVGGLFASGELRVGDAGTGTLTIDKGGLVTSSTGTVGAQAGSQGTVTVTGVDGLDFFGSTIRSTWTVAGELQVGSHGTGALTIENGGIVTSNPGFVGAFIGSAGEARVTGAGSLWTTFGALEVGSFGRGKLTIDGGGVVSSSSGSVGTFVGSAGQVIVTGPGSQWLTNDLFVGNAGTGTMNIQNGASVASASGALGTAFGSVGTVTVGGGAGWGITGDLVVGGDGTGALFIEGGSRVASFAAAVGSSSKGSGMIEVTGMGSRLDVTTLVRLGLTAAGLPGGTGELKVSDGGLVKAAEIDVGPGGKVRGNGTIEGNVINMGGLIAPGFSPGTLTINGNYTQLAGLLDLEVAGLGLGQFDQLLIHGFADFEGGIIEISFIDGFLPHAGDMFAFILGDLGITLASGVTIMLAGADPSFQFETSLQGNAFTFTALTDARGGAPQGVPEPAPLLLLAVALPLLVGLARKRSQKKLARI